MPGPTGGVHGARPRAWMVVVALVVGACSGDTDSFDLVSQSAAPSTEPTTTQAADPGPPADEGDGDDGDGDGDRETTVPSTAAPGDPADSVTTTTDPPVEDDERAEALCTTLRSAAFAERRQLVADADATAAVSDRCPEDLARSNAAVAVRERVEAVAASTDTPLALADVSCNVTTNRLSFSAQNATVEPLGASIGVTLLDAAGQPIGAAGEPIVVWRLSPGESVAVDVALTPVAVTEGVQCELAGTWFLAETSDVDAGLPDVQDPELASDDPAVWLPRLGETASAAAAAGDAAAVASIEDLRSTDFDAVAALLEAGEPVAPADVRICASSSEGSPTPAWQWVAYEVTPPDGAPFSEVGVFRRGSDGQWRWLTRAVPVGGSAFTGC